MSSFVKALFAIFFLVCSVNGHTQSFNNLYFLDTIVHQADLAGINPRNTVVSTYQKNRLYYIINQRNKVSDTITVFISDSSRIIKSTKAVLPNYSTFDSRDNIEGIDVNDKWLVISTNLSINIYAFVDSHTKSDFLIHHKTIPLQRSYNYVKLLLNDKILLGDCYNHRGARAAEQTYLGVLDITTGNIEKEKTDFRFENIEFTHFNPKHFIDVSTSHIAFAQTTTYEIQLFDHNFKETSLISRNIGNWKKIDQGVMNRIKRSSSFGNLTPIFDTLGFYDDNIISRVEGVWFLTDKRFLVRYIMNESGRKNRYYDFYDQNENGKWSLTDSNIIEMKFPIAINDTVKKENYMIWPSNYHSIFFNEGVICIRNFAEMDYLNDTWIKLYEREKAYYETNSPSFSIFYFRRKE